MAKANANAIAVSMIQATTTHYYVAYPCNWSLSKQNSFTTYV